MNILPDIPRLYTALAEWGGCLIFILLLRKRLTGWPLAAVLAGALAVQSLFLCWTGRLAIPFWIPCMILAVGLMFLLLWGCCRIDLMDVGYCCVRAFVLAEFTAALEWQLHCFFWPDGQAPVLLGGAMLIAVYGAVFLVVWRLEKRHLPRDGHLGISRSELLSAVAIGVAVFAVSNLGFLSTHTPFGDGIFTARTMIDLGGFAILYAHCIQCHELRARQELKSMEQILQNQYTQYQQSQESIELINRKYHDLKHQIALLRTGADPQAQNVYLDQIEGEIKSYEAQNKTGDPMLDTILTTKSLYCIRHNITLTCVVDGALLSFMDRMDLCSIFGNALDNAIECEEGIDDPAKRLIHVVVSAQKGFALLRFENYFEGELAFDEHLPVSTKGDSGYHGFGLKSIRYVAEKYGGSAAVKAEGHWFELTVLLPLPR